MLGLDGLGNVERFADYQQWEEWQIDQLRKGSGESITTPAAKESSSNGAASGSSKKKLSYLEAREFSTIEEKVEAAEDRLQGGAGSDRRPAVAIDSTRLQAALAALDEAQDAVDALYARWAELEAKRA